MQFVLVNVIGLPHINLFHVYFNNLLFIFSVIALLLDMT